MGPSSLGLRWFLLAILGSMSIFWVSEGLFELLFCTIGEGFEFSTGKKLFFLQGGNYNCGFMLLCSWMEIIVSYLLRQCCFLCIIVGVCVALIFVLWKECG